MKKILLVFGIMVLFGSQAVAQTITGTVIDESSEEALPGVNIVLKGTTTGTSTDVDGNFELNVENLQDTLVTSFVGYQTIEEPIDGRTDINISMAPAAISGDEVLVVGYGSQEKSQVTGAISSLSSEDIQEVPVISADQALQGRMAGVDVTASGQSQDLIQQFK